MLDITKYLETQLCSVPMIFKQKISFLVVSVSWTSLKEVIDLKIEIFCLFWYLICFIFHYPSINLPLTISLSITPLFENNDTTVALCPFPVLLLQFQDPL